SKTVATGSRVPRNTHAPLTLPGMLSTAEHCDQSSAIAKLLCSPVLFYHELGGCVINWGWKHKKRWFPVRLCCARDGSVWFLLPFRTPTTRSDLLRPSAPRAGRFLHPLLRPRRLQDRRFLLRAIVPRAGQAEFVVIRRKVARLRQHLRYPLGLCNSLPPDPFLHRANNQIRIPNHGRIRPTKELREQMLDVVFLTNQQVTCATESTGIVEGNQMERVHMNQQRYFLLAGFSLTERTLPDPLIRIGIEHEPVARWQATQLPFLRCFHPQVPILDLS